MNSLLEENIPGWKEVVHPYRKDAAFWHGVWESAGRPDMGVLRDIMVRTRNQFHYAVRRVKKMSKSIRAKNLLEANETGSVDLLIQMKKIKGVKKAHADLPECVAGVNGEIKIVEAFKNVYYELYNSSSTSDQMVQLKQLLQSEISQNCLNEANRITGAAVKEADCRMKPGKSDVSISYTSDALLNAPDIFFDLLAPVPEQYRH